MKKKTPFPMTPFDMLVVPEQLHMMKLFLPYLPSGTQKMLALWIKCQELTNTIAYFRDYPRIGMGECTSPKQVNAMELFEELRPYMKEDEADQIDMALSAPNYDGNDAIARILIRASGTLRFSEIHDAFRYRRDV